MFQMLVYLLKLKLDNWALPEFGPYEYYVGDPDRAWLISFDLNDRDLKPVQAIWIETFVEWRRSKWLPWRSYAYVTLEQPKTAYHYLVKSPSFINKDGMVLTGTEMAEIIRENLLRVQDNNDPFWTPALQGRLGNEANC